MDESLVRGKSSARFALCRRGGREAVEDEVARMAIEGLKSVICLLSCQDGFDLGSTCDRVKPVRNKLKKTSAKWAIFEGQNIG